MTDSSLIAMAGLLSTSTGRLKSFEKEKRISFSTSLNHFATANGLDRPWPQSQPHPQPRRCVAFALLMAFLHFSSIYLFITLELPVC